MKDSKDIVAYVMADDGDGTVELVFVDEFYQRPFGEQTSIAVSLQSLVTDELVGIGEEEVDRLESEIERLEGEAA